MLAELRLRSSFHEGATLDTIYFGGGTPSVLTDEELHQLLSEIRKHYTVSDSAEITVECNPDDLTSEKLSALQMSGVNRLSIGLQSFNEEELKWMNRAHTAEESLRSVKLAQSKGFKNITIDLIYGSRFQTMKQWQSTLQTVVDLGVQHISAYNLTIEQKTALGNLYSKGKEPEISEELSTAQFQLMQEVLAGNGFIHYEISNFGKEGYFSKHNTGYWNGNRYLGVGPSAHSFDGEKRSWNVSSNASYIRALQKGDVFYQEETLSLRDRYNEYIMTRLRTMWGCHPDEIEKLFGSAYADKFRSDIVNYTDYLHVTDGSYVLNASGKLMADRIASELFAD